MRRLLAIFRRETFAMIGIVGTALSVFSGLDGFIKFSVWMSEWMDVWEFYSLKFVTIVLSVLHLDLPIVLRLLVAPSLFLFLTVVSCTTFSMRANQPHRKFTALKSLRKPIAGPVLPAILLLLLVISPSAHFFLTLQDIQAVREAAILQTETLGQTDQGATDASRLLAGISNELRVDAQLKYGLSDNALQNKAQRSVFDFIVIEAELGLIWDGHSATAIYTGWALGLITISCAALCLLTSLGGTFSLLRLRQRSWRILFILIALITINYIAIFADQIRDPTKIKA